MSKHVAFIPARKGSKGFKFKNRILFSHTANFINQIDWFDEVIVSTDDHFFSPPLNLSPTDF